MNKQLSTEQVLQFFDKKMVLSALPMFNRLEARPRTHDFDRALRAEIRDALWMLTKQWQMGEFKGDDAGSPVSSKVYMEKTMLTKYRPGQAATETFDDTVPLETKVEQRRIPFLAGDLEISLDLRLLMGRHWAKLLDKHGFDSKLKENYKSKFSIYSPKPDEPNDVYYCASQQSWCKHVATASRHIDGKKLYDDIVEDSRRHVRTVDADPTLQEKLVALGQSFVKWFNNLFYHPHGETANDAWMPSNLEYQFACSAPKNSGEKVFTAQEYYHGHLDWYNFSIDSKTTSLGDVVAASQPDDFDAPIIRSFIPTPTQFDGMPNMRWWAFEEGRTNFGDIRPDTTEINKLLLIQFGLVYANDWYSLPVTLPAGTIANIRGMSVRNVFGENLWVTATGRGLDDNPNRWTMYSMDITGTDRQAADLSLMIVPSVLKIQEGKPIEEVQLVRDEVANMVWGIEIRVPLPCGESIPGREAARDTLRHLNRIISKAATGEVTTIGPAANLRYKIMSSVPENWIPFIATHEEGSIRDTRLQRGSMPRTIEGKPAIEKIKPRTNLLREGLNQKGKNSYFINEEEVLRAGTNVKQCFQRTRWYNGQVYNWLGVRKHTGRGEASSNLKFDYLQSVNKKES